MRCLRERKEHNDVTPPGGSVVRCLLLNRPPRLGSRAHDAHGHAACSSSRDVRTSHLSNSSCSPRCRCLILSASFSVSSALRLAVSTTHLLPRSFSSVLIFPLLCLPDVTLIMEESTIRWAGVLRRRRGGAGRRPCCDRRTRHEVMHVSVCMFDYVTVTLWGVDGVSVQCSGLDETMDQQKGEAIGPNCLRSFEDAPLLLGKLGL